MSWSLFEKSRPLSGDYIGQKIPFIEDYTNRSRYGGNYYVVMQRDRYRCKLCGSTTNLCMHHITGYIKGDKECNKEHNLISLCRTCHANVHLGKIDLKGDF